MRIFSIIFLLIAVIAYCIYEQLKPIPEKASTISAIKKGNDIGIKWNDSLWKYLPKEIDTSIVVYDSKGNPLRFSQYLQPVFNHEAIIFRDKEVLRLHRLTTGAQDSLTNDEYAVDARTRWDAWRNPDTVKSWKTKLELLALTLGQADHILVLKGKHKMIVTRKGNLVKSFRINMGFQPVGNKVEDGDGKTPEGIYNVDGKVDRADRFYKSYVISYPNAKDKLVAKKRGVKVGFGVSIHGTPKAKSNATDWTAGCIAMKNSDLDQLFTMIANGTTIEIRK